MSEKRRDRISEYVREHIRRYREEAGLSQAELAEVLGKSNSNISDIERGRLEISAAELGLIAEALHKPIVYFFPHRTAGKPAEGELSGLEAELIENLRRVPYTAVEEIILRLVKDLAAWTEKDEFQRMAQELMKAGKVLLEKD